MQKVHQKMKKKQAIANYSGTGKTDNLRPERIWGSAGISAKRDTL
jgi:hypothetical protein